MKRLGNWLVLFLKDERGAVMILVALLIVFVLIGMAALSVDVGYLYLQRRHLQNTADAAALAAAWELPWENSAITSTALLYAGHNHIDSTASDTSVVVTDPYGDRRKVKVEITKNYPLFFALAPPIGQTNADVYAMAVATKRMPGMDLLPFTLLDYDQNNHPQHGYDAIIGDEYRYYRDNGNLNYNDPYYDANYNRTDPNRDLVLVGNEEVIIKDWAENKNHFYNLMKEIIPVDIITWNLSNSAGNFGLVDMSDFSDSPSVTPGNINHNAIKYILENGLDRPFCEDLVGSTTTRSSRPGYIAAIDNKGPVGIPLSERLDRDQDDGFYIILVTPKKGIEIQGNNSLTNFSLEHFIIGYVKPLILNNNGNLEGTIIEIIDCETLDPSSWHNRVMLIE